MACEQEQQAAQAALALAVQKTIAYQDKQAEANSVQAEADQLGNEAQDAVAAATAAQFLYEQCMGA